MRNYVVQFTRDDNGNLEIIEARGVTEDGRVVDAGSGFYCNLLEKVNGDVAYKPDGSRYYNRRNKLGQFSQ